MPMTNEQRRKTRAALQHYGLRCGRAGSDRRAWAEAIESTLDNYDQHDPVRAELLRMRYLEHRTEDETIDQLHIGRTTYQKAHLDMLSTVAVYAAQHGARL